ncbi:MAG: DUF3887 domain-containing protein [Gammaproteobacteria bacterium]
MRGITTLGLCLSLVYVLTSCATQHYSAEVWNTDTQKAKAFVVQWANGNYGTASVDFNDALMHTATPQNLQATWNQITAIYGDYQGIGETSTSEISGKPIIIVNVLCKKGPLSLHVVFDTDGKIAGFVWNN